MKASPGAVKLPLPYSPALIAVTTFPPSEQSGRPQSQQPQRSLGRNLNEGGVFLAGRDCLARIRIGVIHELVSVCWIRSLLNPSPAILDALAAIELKADEVDPLEKELASRAPTATQAVGRHQDTTPGHKRPLRDRIPTVEIRDGGHVRTVGAGVKETCNRAILSEDVEVVVRPIVTPSMTAGVIDVTVEKECAKALQPELFVLALHAMKLIVDQSAVVDLRFGGGGATKRRGRAGRGVGQPAGVCD